MVTDTPSRKKVTASETGAAVMSKFAAAAEHAPYRPSLDDVRRIVESRMKAKIEEIQTKAGLQLFEPEGWADLYVVCPVQWTAPALMPSSVIAVGETAYVITVLALNPAPILPGPMSPKDVLEGFNVDCTLQYRTGNLSTWTLAEGGLQIDSTIHLSPGGGIFGSPFYVDVQPIAPTQTGIHEMTVASRILGGGAGSHFAGFATWSLDTDFDFLAWLMGVAQPPAFRDKAPVRFDVYQP